jgi:hypothetical protein
MVDKPISIARLFFTSTPTPKNTSELNSHAACDLKCKMFFYNTFGFWKLHFTRCFGTFHFQKRFFAHAACAKKCSSVARHTQRVVKSPLSTKCTPCEFWKTPKYKMTLTIQPTPPTPSSAPPPDILGPDIEFQGRPSPASSQVSSQGLGLNLLGMHLLSVHVMREICEASYCF